MIARRGAALTAAGFGAFLIAFVALPASVPLQARILLLAPLVIVPRLIDAVPVEQRPLPVNGPLALAAAVPLVIAFAFATGPVAAAFALPWLAVTGALGLAAAWRGARQLPGILRPSNARELGLLAAFGFLAVAALFAVSDRLGVQPGGFSADIILLTAVHFHFAGFGLLLIASFMAARRQRLSAVVFGLLLGIPITALGFVTGSNALNALGALVTGLSGIGLALGLLVDRSPMRMPARVAWRLAGLALLVGMPMAIAWSVAIALGSSFLNIDVMVRTHGALNATAVLLVALAVAPLESR